MDAIQLSLNGNSVTQPTPAMPAMTQMPAPKGTLPTLMDVLGGKLQANNNQVKYQTLDVDPLVRNAFRCGECRQISIKKDP